MMHGQKNIKCEQHSWVCVSVLCCCPVGSVTVLFMSRCCAAVQWAVSPFSLCLGAVLLSSGQCHRSVSVSVLCCCPVGSVTVLLVSHTARATANCCNPSLTCMILKRIIEAAATIRQQPGTFMSHVSLCCIAVSCVSSCVAVRLDICSNLLRNTTFLQNTSVVLLDFRT